MHKLLQSRDSRLGMLAGSLHGPRTEDLYFLLMRLFTCLLILVTFSLGGCDNSVQATGATEVIRVATYNVENWHTHFHHHRLTKLEPESIAPAPPAMSELLTQLRFANTEDNWELSLVIKDLNADVLLIQEGPGQPDLEYFNRKWLEGMYETVKVFQTNTTRVQTLAVMVKPGFKVLETVETLETPDPEDLNPRSDRLFARGPAFVHVQTPAGKRLWIGTTHQKSKAGNSLAATRWRIAEGRATYKIMLELHQRTGDGVLLAGDMNDTLGLDDHEATIGQDAVEALVGPGTHLVTRTLAESGAISFGGYDSPRYRSFIDHAVATSNLATVAEASVYNEPLSQVASDHFPVLITLTLK